MSRNARKLMTTSSGGIISMRLRKYISFCLQAPNVLQRMLVEQILKNPGHSFRIEIVEARVKIDGNNRRCFPGQQRFGLLKKLSAFVRVFLKAGLPHQGIISRAFPSRPIVAAVAGEQIEESVRVVVVANPARGG